MGDKGESGNQWVFVYLYPGSSIKQYANFYATANYWINGNNSYQVDYSLDGVKQAEISGNANAAVSSIGEHLIEFRYPTGQSPAYGRLDYVSCNPASPDLHIQAYADNPVIFGLEDIQFHDVSAPASTSILWDFGDGQTSTEVNPLHHYGAEGEYLSI